MENERRKATDLTPSSKQKQYQKRQQGWSKSPLPDNTIRNCKQALRVFSYWLWGREITDRRLAEYATWQSPGTISIIVSAVKWLLKYQNGRKPSERILPLAFSKPAEQELLERKKDIGKVDICTVHGFARRIINENLELLDLDYRSQVPEEKNSFKPFIRRFMKEDSKTGRVDAGKLC